MLIPFKDLYLRYQMKVDGVVHLGANTGQEAESYQAWGVSTVIWVEALPDVYAKLLKHISGYEDHCAWNACLSDTDGQEVVFHVASNDAQSSSFLEFGTHSREHPTVRYVRDVKMVTSRWDTLAKEKQVDLYGRRWFLNVDLQGAELLALKGMGDLLACFSYAYIEVNEKELYRGCPLVGEIDAYLARFGFLPREVKMTGFGWGDKFYTR